MKRCTILILSVIFIITNAYSQNNANNSKQATEEPFFLIRLSDGSERLTKVPIISYPELENFDRVKDSKFYEQNPELKGESVFVYTLKPSVKRIIDLTEILTSFNINKKYWDFDIQVEKYPRYSKKATKTILATEGSIETVSVDEKRQVITIHRIAK